jgi:CRISPR-associated exonuclease Cas4
MAVLLGANNHGKSNILSALEFALTPGDKPKENDFCSFRTLEEDQDLWVELTFCELTEQEKNTWKRYLLLGDVVRFRKTATLKDGGAAETSYVGYSREYSDWWLRPEASLTTKEEYEKTPLKEIPITIKGKIAQKALAEAQAAYIEAHKDEIERGEAKLETTPLMGQKNVAAGLLPDFYLIPAVKDLSDETKTKSTSLFGRLLNRAVKEMAEKDPRFAAMRTEMEALVKTLNRPEAGGEGERPSQLTSLESNLDAELKAWGVSVEIEVLPPAIDKIFEMGTNLHLDDGVRTLAEHKGHGLQRAVLFALIRAWAKALRPKVDEAEETKARVASDTIIFAVEEPELFLHPHAQRRLAKALEEIANTPGHQVFLCSHSTHFVDLDHYKRVAIAYKPTSEEGTKVRQCMVDLFEGEGTEDRKKRFHMAKWVNPDRGEIFFAKRVVFVEGETETTMIPFLGEKLGIFDPEVSIIDCGSKHNLPLYISIATAFEIPFVVVHDEDSLPDTIPADWDEEKVKSKRRTFALNATIKDAINPRLGQVVVLCRDFEQAAGVSRSQGEKKGKALAALDHFYEKDKGAIPPVLVDLVKAVYAQETPSGTAAKVDG